MEFDFHHTLHDDVSNEFTVTVNVKMNEWGQLDEWSTAITDINNDYIYIDDRLTEQEYNEIRAEVCARVKGAYDERE